MVYKTSAKQMSEVIISELTLLYLIGTAVVLEEKIYRSTHVTAPLVRQLAWTCWLIQPLAYLFYHIPCSVSIL